MYYIHYDSEGYILSAANHTNAPLWIETSKEIYQDFITGAKQFHEYKVIEDIRTKGKMQIIQVEVDEIVKNEHETGVIQKNTNLTKGIIFVQKENYWIVNNFIDNDYRLISNYKVILNAFRCLCCHLHFIVFFLRRCPS